MAQSNDKFLTMTNKNDKILAPIKNRIVQFIENQNIEKNKIFENLGVASSNFRGQALFSEISADIVAKILSLYPELDLYWLILGEGEMIRKINEPQETIEVEKGAQTPCDEIKIIAKERAYIIDLQKDKIEMQNKIIEDLELKLQKFKKEEKSIERHSEKPTLLEI